MTRPLVVLALTLALVATVGAAVLRGVVPEVAAEPTVESSLGTPLTERLAFVVVDGLRYDVAIDPERMPHFAAAMRDHASAEVWAGPVSMTSSAILAYGTGRHGGLDQIVYNVRPRPTPYDSWLRRVSARGDRIALAGDRGWARMYPRSIAERHLDPRGVGIDVPFDDEIFAAARRLSATRPRVLIAHFVTPDHQGHAHGIRSAGYARYIRGFDEKLHAFVEELSPDWTVIVTSDHGAGDSGTHGADLPLHRRSPLYARGAGIAPRAPQGLRLDQVELAGTVAALLGAPAPAQARGRVATELLSGAPSRAAAAPRVAVAAPRFAGLGAPLAWILTALAGALAFAVARLVFGSGAARAAGVALLVAAAAIGLVYSVERLPGAGPNVVRFALFVAVNAGLLALLWDPARVSALLERRALAAFVLLPGLLVVAYPANLQPEAFAVVVVGGLALLRLEERPSRSKLAALVVLSLPLLPAALRAENIYGSWPLRAEGPLMVAVVLMAALLASAAVLARRGGRTSWGAVALGTGLVALGLLGRDVVAPWIGWSATAALWLAAAVSFRRGRSDVALQCAVGAVAWLARPWELVPFVAAAAVAHVVGTSIRRRERWRFVDTLLAVAFVFALSFVLRVAMTGHLDLVGLDWRAGTFGDPVTPPVRVGAALVAKSLVAELVVLGAFVMPLRAERSSALLQAVLVAFAVRVAVLAAMLIVCARSYWTAFRVLGDLPFAAVGAVAVAIAWLAVAARGRQALASSAPLSSSS